MIHEKIPVDDLAVTELTNIIHSYWDKIVSGKMDDNDVKSIRNVLFVGTNNSTFSKVMSELLGVKKPDNEIVPAKMKKILAEAMTAEFLLEKHFLWEWTMLLHYWDIFDLFKKNIKEKLATEKEICVNAIRQVSVQSFEHSEFFVFESDRPRFLNKVEYWKKENDIQEFWTWGAREWYAYNANLFLIPKLLLPEYPKIFLEIAAHLTFPTFLYELIASVYRKKDTKYISLLLQEAPVSVNEAADMQWNQSWVAPVILDEVFENLVNIYPVNHNLNADEKKDIQAIFNEVGNILIKRVDGLFLVLNYVQHLASGKKRNQILSSICLEELGNCFHNKAKERYFSPEFFREFSSEDVSFIRKSFTETGILKKKQNKSAYMELLTWIQFFFDDDEYLKNALSYLELSLMFSDDKINTCEGNPKQCHYDIASIYLIKFGENVVKGWKDTWKLFAMARYRSMFNYYDSNSVEVRTRLNFLLSVAIALLNHMYNIEKWETMNEFWEELWKIMEERMQNKFSKNEKFNEDYVQILYGWKAMQICKMHKKTDDSDEFCKAEIAKFVLYLESYPEIYFRVLDWLSKNDYFDARDLKIQRDLS